jgi:transketolase
MALSARRAERDFRVFVLLGDGECNEGQVWEAAMAASHHRLGAITAIVDRNRYCLDGEVDEVMGIEPLGDKFAAFGWEVASVDGHDVEALLQALGGEVGRERPRCVIANTVKGKGVSFMEEHIGWHLGYLAPPDERRALAEIRAES